MLTSKGDNNPITIIKAGGTSYAADLYGPFTELQTVMDEGTITSYQAECYRSTTYTFDSEEAALAYFEENYETEFVLAKARSEELSAQQKVAMAKWLFAATDYRYNKAIREKSRDVSIKEWLDTKYPGFMDATERWTRILNGETDLEL